MTHLMKLKYIGAQKSTVRSKIVLERENMMYVDVPVFHEFDVLWCAVHTLSV